MTRTVCPNCGAPWRGLRSMGEYPHLVAVCCGCSEEYLAKLEASPTVALSVRLAEIEYSAKRGASIPPADVLDIITELRRYMAFADEINQRTEGMLKVLAE
jgi:hypothetical protein